MRPQRIWNTCLLVTWILFVTAVPGRAAAPLDPLRRTAVVEVVERVSPAVVNIHSERTAQGPAPEEVFSQRPAQNRINGMGTGIIIDPRGYIITNQHVVEDVNLIRVRLHDRTSYTARVLARDHENDLALLKIDTSKPLAVMPLGTATDLMVGETVIAIGNAYGYENTVTTGIVSALKRDVTLNKDISYRSLIQTSAEINPGNSGGPLLNIHGQLVGVNVAIRAGAQGIAFAIPVDTMISVAADMMSIRKRNRTWHGMIVRDRLDLNQGAPIRSVVLDHFDSTGPAAAAGLRKGDELVRIGDLEIDCCLDVERALLDRLPEERIPVIVRRNGVERRVELVLNAADRASPSAQDLIWRKLGVRLSSVRPELVSRANNQLHGGLTVSDLNPDGVAAKAGIQVGDILVGLHQWETLTLENVAFVLNHPDLASFNPLRFYIVRGGQVHRGWLQQVD